MGSPLFPKGGFNDFQSYSPPHLLYLHSFFSLPFFLTLPCINTAIPNHNQAITLIYLGPKPIPNHNPFPFFQCSQSTSILSHIKPFPTTSHPHHFNHSLSTVILGHIQPFPITSFLGHIKPFPTTSILGHIHPLPATRPSES